MKSVHYCPATKKTIERKYSDLTSLEPLPTSAIYPTRVSCYSVDMQFHLHVISVKVAILDLFDTVHLQYFATSIVRESLSLPQSLIVTMAHVMVCLWVVARGSICSALFLDNTLIQLNGFILRLKMNKYTKV